MTKRQLIDQIIEENTTADPGFLAMFEPAELGAYLSHLRQARLPRLAGDPHRFDHYFENAPKIHWQPAERMSVAAAEPDDLPADTGGDPEDQPADEGLYVTDESSEVHDAPAVAEGASSDESPDTTDSLDLAYVPAGQSARRNPPTDNKRKESSFAETQEDAEAWLF